MAICENCGHYEYGIYKCKKCGGKMVKASRRYKPLLFNEQCKQKNPVFKAVNDCER